MKFLITAGPTREPIDPVRYLSNRSSGKMGFAVAAAAAASGHEVILVSGPVDLDTPAGVQRIDIETAQELYDAVQTDIRKVACAIMAAAVADYRPAEFARQKIKKPQAHTDHSNHTLRLELVKTPDILGSARDPMGFTGLLVGFAAETENLAANAMEKLERKGCDLIVANDVSRAGIGFDADENEVTIFSAAAAARTISKTSKADIARTIIELCEAALV